MTAIDVLVADDDEDTRAAIVIAVTSLGYRCRSASDGRAALEEQAREPAAVVMTDWGMPHLDGLALCSAVKKAPSPPYVILMTTVPESAVLFAAMRRGTDHFLRKPFGLDDLEACLHAAARLVRGQRGLADVHKRAVARPPPVPSAAGALAPLATNLFSPLHRATVRRERQ
jgi:DNA-binding response OmpR family regulator